MESPAEPLRCTVEINKMRVAATDVDLGMGFGWVSLGWGSGGGLGSGLPLFHAPVVDPRHVHLRSCDLIPKIYIYNTIKQVT